MHYTRRIVFCFSGTSDPGEYFAADLEKNNLFYGSVIRVYIRGCSHYAVGGLGGGLLPDLEGLAAKIRMAFDASDNSFNLDKLKSLLGAGICRIEGTLKDTNPVIESIGLYGFSRGAVSTFATARHLDDLNIPIDILANQPVPGEACKNTCYSLYRKNHDLRTCLNIRSATTLLAAVNRENSPVENGFYNQMVAKFASSAMSKNLLIPHQRHLRESWIVPIHINKFFNAHHYAATPMEIFFDEDLDGLLEAFYTAYSDNFAYTPGFFSQPLFGAKRQVIAKDPAWIASISQKAFNILSAAKMSLTEELSEEQAFAILAIHKANSLTVQDDLALYQFILDENEKSLNFIRFINQICEMMDYLIICVIKLNSHESRSKIDHANAFKMQCIEKAYALFVQNSSSFADKKALVKGVKEDYLRFMQLTANKDQGFLQSALNFVLQVVFVFTGIHGVHQITEKQTASNWLFYQRRQQIKTAWKEIPVLKIAASREEQEENTGKTFVFQKY